MKGAFLAVFPVRDEPSKTVRTALEHYFKDEDEPEEGSVQAQ